jgi:hypothetical protein
MFVLGVEIDEALIEWLVATLERRSVQSAK